MQEIQGYSDKYQMTYGELTDYLSDFHKSVFGFRCRMYGEPIEAVEAELDSVYAYMEREESTFEGRQRLREDGWVIEETDPELQAKAEEAERIKQAWYAEQDRMWEQELRAVQEEECPTTKWLDDMYNLQEELTYSAQSYNELNERV